MKYKLPALFLCVFVLISCSKDDNDIFESNSESTALYTSEIQNYTQEQSLLEVAYGLHEQQVFDIYLPEGRTSTTTKVLIIIHGGGWVNGDKSSFTNFALELKEKNPNYAIVNINYVLGSEDHFAFPNQFFDIEKVINFIKLRQNEYRINPEFGLIGSSAGGHLALQYTYKYDQNKDVKFVASLGGPTDFLDDFYQENTETLVNLLVDQTYYQDYNSQIFETTYSSLLKRLSPKYQIKEDTSPTLLIYGNQDMVVPISNANSINEKLTQKNVAKSLEVFSGGHGGWKSDSRIENTHEIIKDFIMTHF